MHASNHGNILLVSLRVIRSPRLEYVVSAEAWHVGTRINVFAHGLEAAMLVELVIEMVWAS